MVEDGADSPTPEPPPPVEAHTPDTPPVSVPDATPSGRPFTDRAEQEREPAGSLADLIERIRTRQDDGA